MEAEHAGHSVPDMPFQKPNSSKEVFMCLSSYGVIVDDVWVFFFFFLYDTDGNVGTVVGLYSLLH